MKKTSGTVLLISFLIINICSQCEKNYTGKSYVINIVNKSGHNIGYYFATGGEYGTYYPDSLPESNEYIVYDMNKVLHPGYESHLNWESFFQELPYDTLSVFIFHTDTLNKYSWNEVRERYLILKRYDMSLDDLNQNNFTITYP